MTRNTDPAAAIATSLMKDVLRGVKGRPLNEQHPPNARWMETDKILASGETSYDPKRPGKRVLFGALGDHLIGIEDERHIMTVAGSRAGKSVGLISNLLFYTGSILATDPKGELAELTAERRAAMGQKVYVLDPFNKGSARIAKYRASYNPMDILSLDSETFLEDAANIADAIVVPAPDAKDPHWDESAKNFIEGVILHIATDPAFKDERNLISVRKCLTRALVLPPQAESESAKKRAARPKLFDEMQSNADRLDKDDATEAVAHALRAAALDFYSKGETEIAGVHSTVNRQTKFLDYPAFRRVLRESTFDLGELKRNPKGVSVYLCFPATRTELSKRWMRLFVNQLLDAMEREKTKPAVPVLACLDEFPVLGYMRQLETAAGLIASFGVKLWFILQDWSQGKALYGDRWETFAGNAGVLQFFGNNDVSTAEYISRRLGKAQVEVFRRGEVAQDQSEKGLSGRSQSIELYDLMTPDEIMRTFARADKQKRQILIWAGKHPMILQRVEHHALDSPLQPYLR